MITLDFYHSLSINEKINVKSRHSATKFRFKDVAQCSINGSIFVQRCEQPFSNSIEFIKCVPISVRFLRKF